MHTGSLLTIDFFSGVNAMKSIQGIAASEGIATGPAHRFFPQLPPIETARVDDTEAEIMRLDSAVSDVDSDLAELIAHITNEVGEDEAAIFEAHRMFLSDKAFIGRAQTLISEDRVNAPHAIETVVNELKQTFEAMDDEYFRERAMDVVDVARRLIRATLGLPQPSLAGLSNPCIVVADDLTPSDTARMDREMVLGFCTAKGGKTAHAAILARSMCIPAVVGAGKDVLEIPQDEKLILDGQAGLVISDPSSKVQQEYEERRAQLDEIRLKVLSGAHQPAVTLDGHQVEVVANIGAVEETEQVLACGGEGVGLLRTEFLYLNRTTPPDEDEQTEVYRAIANALDPGPLIIRTLDIGGDKPLPYLEIQAEDNPFLGHRGIRLCLAEPEMFKIQLRAILRSAEGKNVKVMFPMVATIEEVQAAKILLEESRNELEERGLSYGDPDIGVMVEIPSVAVTADILAQEVNFFSIGTNDLTQYTLAADRTNALVQGIADALHPAVLRLIAETIRHAHNAGIWVGLCGELAGDPIATPILLGLGLDEFSMAASSIPFVKEVIRECSLEATKELAREALTLKNAAQVREIVDKHSKSRFSE
jgi:phosphoenolpyruvate-protein phosphotransferase